MFCQEKKNNFAQITTEYAILAALIIAALIGMQIYLKRGIQARLKGAMDYPVTTGVFNTSQYEPGMTNTTRNDTRNDTVSESMTWGLGITRESTEILSTNITSTTGDF